ncbi:hypothetical protein [Bremerella sp.]|uniref:hypothetical protein n=1 Tax=Bremerella sp. TaxID=2795602 RepID=UPI003919392F
MSATILEREPFTCDVAAEQNEFLADDLAEEAYEVLGYATRQAKVKRLQSLQKTLEELDIRPFTLESVEKYKKSCEVPPSRLAVTLVDFSAGLGLLGAIVCLPILVVSAVTLNASLSFYLALVILIGGACLIASAAVGDRFVVERVWLTYDLAHYTEPVPEFALQTALDIKKRHPEVNFYVCSLEERRMVLDPFLVMRVPGDAWYKEYYLEVWSEPKFSGEREA